MINLVIGRPVSSLDDTFTITDYYEGLDYLESNPVKSISFNLEESILNEEKYRSLFNYLKELQIPTLIFSDNVELKKFVKCDFIAVLPTSSSPAYIMNRYTEVLDYKSLFNQISDISQQKRTVPFYILGSLLLLEPLIKILYFKVDTGFEFSTIFEIIFTINNPIKMFEFWLLFPVAGIALFRSSAYSLFVFAGVYLYSTFAYFSYEKFTWPYVQENPHISANLLLVFNTLLLIYFLIPENRKPFTDKTRYYFSKPIRMSLNFKTLLKIDKKEVDATVLNISSTGVLISLNEPLKQGHLSLKIWDINFDCSYIREVESEKENEFNYGLKFKFRNKAEKTTLLTFIKNSEDSLIDQMAISA